MNKYFIRPAEINDINAISSVAWQSWNDTYGSIFPKEVIRQFVSRAYSEENLTDTIKRDKSHSSRYFHVAENPVGEVIAFSQSMPIAPDSDSSFELLRIYALPKTHGTGIGKSLLDFLFQTAPNLRKLVAWVEQENTVGKNFYERHNFKLIDEKPDNVFGHKTTLLKYQYNRD